MAVETRRCSVAVLLAAMLGICFLGWAVATINQNLADPDKHPELFDRISEDADVAAPVEAEVEQVQWVTRESSRSMLGLSGTLQLLMVAASFALYFFGRRAADLRDRRLTLGFGVVMAACVLTLVLGPARFEAAGVAFLVSDVVKAVTTLALLLLLLRGMEKAQPARLAFAGSPAPAPGPIASPAPVASPTSVASPASTGRNGSSGAPAAVPAREEFAAATATATLSPPRPGAHPSRALELVDPLAPELGTDDAERTAVEGAQEAFHNLLMGAIPVPTASSEVVAPQNLENSVSDESMSCEPLSSPADATRFDNVPDMEHYRELYAESVTDPEGFWAAQARRLHWEKPWDKVLEWDFHTAQVKWFAGGKLNVSYNCIDRHVDAGHGNQVAIIWEGDDPDDDRKYTYRELQREVCRFANVLKSQGVKKGDRVCIYLPMIPELAFAMLACARIGAIHNIVFAGFSANSLRDRILDSECTALITADEGLRGGRAIPLKKIADEAIAGVECIKTMLLVRRTGRWQADGDGREVWIDDLMASGEIGDECPPEPMDAEDPLFILYTSGSTGKPKGVLHTTGGYLTYAAFTHQMVFDHQPGEVYWCTADIGWITGHSYIVYGPLANRATTLMFEGVPSYPDHGRFWDVVDKHQVSVFYTAPTAIRAVAQHGDAPVKARKRSSLRLLGTVGEPINPEIWKWYHEVVGEGRCPIVDTWWQTETGGILITPLPRATPLKPGSATLPFFGVRPLLVDEDGEEVKGNAVSGNLCIAFPWPGMMRTVHGDHQRFVDTYFSRFPGRYFTGDGCRRDADGYYWITGRVDDVINVSGHRLGTAEVESALVSHAAVAEAAVVGFPHEIKGTGIYAYCILNDGHEATKELHDALVAHVRAEIGPIATPDRLHFTPGLPKTRSGKIMRRILRKVAAGETEELGDTSTLADPSVVDAIVKTASA